MNVILHPEVESKIKLKVVRSLGDVEPGAEDVSNSDITLGNINAEDNEALLEEGVSLKTEESDPEDIEIENGPDDKSTEQS